MRPRPLAELVELMQPAEVELYGDEVLVGPDIVLDNREATPGSIFVAIPGERVDGHDYATAAVECGAAAVLANHVTDTEVPHLLVPNSVAGLSFIARGIVREARARGLVSIGITGSSGKTSTKDLVAQVLEAEGPTVSPVGSQNNEIGVPLTACRIDDDTRFLVSEMGARGIGHIAWLTSLVPLDIAVVLNVGRAHVGEFGSVQQTALAKGELVRDLEPDGWAVLNGDDPAVRAMAGATRGRLAWFGEGDLRGGDVQLRASNVATDPTSQARFDLTLTRDGETATVPVQLGVVGRHQVSNALATAAVGIVAGMTLEAVASALATAVPRSSWRMELQRRGDGVLILNDAYNANPDSTAAALRTAVELGQMQRDAYPDARVVAVLGDMLELGPVSHDEHVATGNLAADLRVGELVAVGEFAEQLVEGATLGGLPARVAARDDVAASLHLAPGDVVLVKGSRGIGLERVAEQLLQQGEQK